MEYKLRKYRNLAWSVPIGVEIPETSEENLMAGKSEKPIRESSTKSEDVQSLEILKEIKLGEEIRKLKEETKELKRKWWQRPAFIAALLPSILGIVLLYFGYKDDYIKLRQEEIKWKQSEIDTLEISLAARKKELKNIELSLNTRSDQLDNYKKKLELREKHLESSMNDLELREATINNNEKELDKREKLIAAKKGQLDHEREIANTQWHINQLKLKGRYVDPSHDSAEALLSYFSEKSKKKYNRAFDSITKSLKEKSISPELRGTLFAILYDGTHEAKWKYKLFELYKKEISNITWAFFDIFYFGLDEEPPYEITELLFNSLELEGFQSKLEGHVYLTISRIWFYNYQKGKFSTPDFASKLILASRNFVLKTSDTSRKFVKGQIRGYPDKHTDPGAFDIHNGLGVMYGLKSPAIAVTMCEVMVRGGISERAKKRIEDWLPKAESILFHCCRKDSSQYDLPKEKADLTDWVKWQNSNKAHFHKWISIYQYN